VRTIAIALLAAVAAGLGVHFLARPGAAPTPAERAVETPSARAAVRRVAPRRAELPREESLVPPTAPESEDVPTPAPEPDWLAEVDAKIEREVSQLHGERQVRSYLDTLLAEARRRGAVSPVETRVGRHAVNTLTDLSGEERERMLNDYQERVLDLQAELQGTPRPVRAPADDRRAPDRLIAELRRGGQSPEARAELRQELMHAVEALPAGEREARLTEVHALLAGEQVE